MERRRRPTLRDVLYVSLKNKAAVATVFLAALVVSLVYCIVTPPVYRAETKLVVKTDGPRLPGLNQYRPESYVILSPEGNQGVNREIGILKGEYLTGKVLARLEGRIKPLKTGRAPIGRIADAVRAGIRAVLSIAGFSPGPSDPDKRMALTFLDALRVAPLEDPNMVSITFDWTDPAFAALVANSYADEYATQYGLVDDSRRLYAFYADQVGLLAKKLKEADDRYQSFLSSSNIADITLQKDLLLRTVADLGNRLNLVDIDIGLALARLEKIKEMMRNPREWNKPAETLLDEAGMELSLSRRKKSNLRYQLSTEQKKLDSINAKTVALEQLEREREIAEQNYRTYRNTAEDLRVSDDLGTAKISSVKVAVPAIPPITPIYPNKGRIILFSAVGGLLLGFLCSAVREFFNHTFRNESDVTQILNLSLLLSVPLKTYDGPVDGTRRGRTNDSTSRLRRLLGQELRRPSAGNGAAKIGGAILLSSLLAMAGFLQFSKLATVSQYRFTMARTVVPEHEEGRAVSLSIVSPAESLRNPDVAVPAPTESKQETPKPALLSEELEKQRKDLERRRAAVEAELRKVRPEG
jgi:polysaccharide biosynthesis transport protein